MQKAHLFLSLTKIDEAKRQVSGVIAEEKPDKVGEVFDYETSKPNFEKWSGGFAKSTNGNSLGNVRAMHGSIAAGKVAQIGYDDDRRVIEVTAEITDDAEWKKVASYTYTGFSIGGHVTKSWKEADGYVHYTADPVEVSIVDNPCMPGATFQVVKADGSVETVKPNLKTVVQMWACGQKGHEHATKADAISCEPPRLRKSLYDVGDLASCLQSINYIRQRSLTERQLEGDNSGVPDLLEECVRMISEALIQMAEEETSELIVPDGTHTTMTWVASPEFMKSNRGIAKQVRERLESVLAAVPIDDDPEKGVPDMNEVEIQKLATESAAKAFTPELDKVKAEIATFAKAYGEDAAKATEAREATEKKLDEVVAQVADASKAITNLTELLGKVLVPAKGAVRVVTKGEDAVDPEKPEAPKKADPIDLIKNAHAKPVPVFGAAS